MRQVGDRSLSVYRSGDQLHPYVAATNRFVCAGDLFKIFVSATEFCRCNKSQKKNIVRLVGATKFCCSHKDFHKRSPVHTKQFVAAKSRRHMLLQLLSPSVYRPLGFYRNIAQFDDGFSFVRHSEEQEPRLSKI